MALNTIVNATTADAADINQFKNHLEGATSSDTEEYVLRTASGTNFKIRLSDAAGSSKFVLQDSAGVDIFTIDSDGNTILNGYLEVGSESTRLTASTGVLLDGFKFVEKTADESTNTDTTLSDDTHLTFTTLPNAEYAFMCVLHIDDASTGTADFKYNWSETAGDTFDMITWSDGASGVVNATIDEADTSTDFLTDVTNSQDNMLCFTGVIRADASGGTFVLQWAQRVSNGSNVTVTKGSWLAYNQLDLS